MIGIMSNLQPNQLSKPFTISDLTDFLAKFEAAFGPFPSEEQKQGQRRSLRLCEIEGVDERSSYAGHIQRSARHC